MTGRRGRPPKPKEPPKKLFTSNGDAATRGDLSHRIARELGTQRDSFSDALADIGGWHWTMRQLQTDAPILRHKQGNRPKIHLAQLLADCAVALEKRHGLNAKQELARIGEWTEESSPVIVTARAVLNAMGINHPQSLRQQATQALERL